MASRTVAFLSMIAAARAQVAGTLETETHPALTWSQCTASGCTEVAGEIVIDANWRWAHGAGGSENCYDGNAWTDVCSSNADCATCEIEGADYSGTYGVSTSGDALTLNFVTEHAYGTNIGSRTYLMAGTSEYQMFDLMGNEFAFDVDLSAVGCGLNSALYFVAMPSDGGEAPAGAEYGTGYCDAQCARDLKWIGGEGNYEGWESSETDENSGVGGRGACCAEIDIWESNSHAFAFTPHGCTENTYHVCEADAADVESQCGGTYSEDRFAGKCDANGCDYNPYRTGNLDFYGEGKTVDTSQVFTVVTQFTEDAYTQFFVQGGARIDIPAPADYPDLPASSNITDDYCSTVFDVFEDRNRYEEVGGWAALTDALSNPMVLVMSIWADNYANMLWLDSSYPVDEAGTPGADRGDCPTDYGAPDEVIADQPDANVIWSNIRFGPIGSTTGL